MSASYELVPDMLSVVLLEELSLGARDLWPISEDCDRIVLRLVAMLSLVEIYLDTPSCQNGSLGAQMRRQRGWLVKSYIRAIVSEPW